MASILCHGVVFMQQVLLTLYRFDHFDSMTDPVGMATNPE